MRVLVIHNSYLQKGGEDEVVDREVAMLRAHGCEVRLHHTTNEAITRMSRVVAATTAHWSSAAAQAVAAEVDAFAPDVAHVHNTFPLLSPAVHWSLHRRGVPSVMTLHNFRLACPQGLFFREGRVCEDCLGRIPWRAVAHGCYRGRRLDSLVAASTITLHRMMGTYRTCVDRFVATTEFSKRKFEQMGLPASRIDVKPNFVDVPPVPAVADTRSGFLFVGRLAPEKGIDVLLGAIERVEGAHLTVIGDGPLRARVEGHPQVRYLGWQGKDVVTAEMHKATALVVPSVWFETFGLVIVEAFACGLPVVASDLGSMAELVTEHETGRLFPVGDEQALAERIQWFLANPALAAAAGARAQIRYRERFTSAANVDQILAVYRRAIEFRSTGEPRPERA